ncbi:MAG: hypothetical protein BECKG1743D_GA0114223_107262 [Candidatus Kentron sp. G]|nr:MAG: hypothetical protein BECKG1743F_GA0114225_107484 [Candidatus Kentron sp. G]VFN04283.1 MAG: hypothetical protein BECKG1743E_GA0114224_107122 [Candidatus Kentron sp. G]VFN05491.1 MAG: hypothetical protein BECKG1743D_GA0114223_107262 [Candidatus Kentron sp. G]
MATCWFQVVADSETETIGPRYLVDYNGLTHEIIHVMDFAGMGKEIRLMCKVK